MFKEIVEEMARRMATHICSRCATDDEVRICWLITEVDRLRDLYEPGQHEDDKLITPPNHTNDKVYLDVTFEP